MNILFSYEQQTHRVERKGVINPTKGNVNKEESISALETDKSKFKFWFCLLLVLWP